MAAIPSAVPGPPTPATDNPERRDWLSKQRPPPFYHIATKYGHRSVTLTLLSLIFLSIKLVHEWKLERNLVWSTRRLHLE